MCKTMVYPIIRNATVRTSPHREMVLPSPYMARLIAKEYRKLYSAAQPQTDAEYSMLDTLLVSLTLYYPDTTKTLVRILRLVRQYTYTLSYVPTPQVIAKRAGIYTELQMLVSAVTDKTATLAADDEDITITSVYTPSVSVPLH